VLQRRVIRASDIEIFFGYSTRQARRYLKDIREEYNKEKHQPVTVAEFCEYFNVRESEILMVMK